MSNVLNRTVNWDLLTNNRQNLRLVQKWATGEENSQSLRSHFRGTQAGSEFHFALRKYGVTYGRRVARKALRRRGLNI